MERNASTENTCKVNFMESLATQEIPAYFQNHLIFERPANLTGFNFRGGYNKVGAYSYANFGTIVYNTDIGRFCSIAHRVIIAPTEHPTDWLSTSSFAFNDRGVFGWSSEFQRICSDEKYQANDKRTRIGNDVWIGANCFIKRGVTIGDGAIIAAGAIVTKDVQPYSIMTGVPARLLRMRFPDEIIHRLTKIKWWNYHLDRGVIGNIKYSDIHDSLNHLEDLIEDKKISHFTPETVELIR